MTRLKTWGIIILLASLMGLLMLMCVGNAPAPVAAAEMDDGSGLTETLPEDEPKTDADATPEKSPAEDTQDPSLDESIMNTVKDWVCVGFGGVDLVLVCVLLIREAIHAKKAIGVIVDDEKTQGKLEELHGQIGRLQTVVSALLTLNHGTFELLHELFADNPNISEKSKAVIASLTKNSDDVIADVKDLLSQETQDTIRDALQRIGNVTLG